MERKLRHGEPGPSTSDQTRPKRVSRAVDRPQQNIIVYVDTSCARGRGTVLYVPGGSRGNSHLGGPTKQASQTAHGIPPVLTYGWRNHPRSVCWLVRTLRHGPLDQGPSAPSAADIHEALKTRNQIAPFWLNALIYTNPVDRDSWVPDRPRR